MRRKEREITDRLEIEKIIDAAAVCRIGMSDGTTPYIVPVNFYYEGDSSGGGTFYFHSAAGGMKIDILRHRPAVCIEIDLPGDVTAAGSPCEYGFSYRSVIAFGKAVELEAGEEKQRALTKLFERYVESGAFAERAIDPKQTARTSVWRIDIESMTGKTA